MKSQSRSRLNSDPSWSFSAKTYAGRPDPWRAIDRDAPCTIEVPGQGSFVPSEVAGDWGERHAKLPAFGLETPEEACGADDVWYRG